MIRHPGEQWNVMAHSTATEYQGGAPIDNPG
jgi:hypothetical protein